MESLCLRVVRRETVVAQWLWWGLFVLVPLAALPVSRWQYEPPKATLTLMLVGLLLGISIGRGTLPQGRCSQAETWLVAALGLRWLATSCSVMPTWSLWGDPAWRNGLWLTLATVVVFVLAHRQLATPSQRMRIIDAILIGSALVAGYGVLQYANLDPFGHTDLVRVPSTLSHPNLLAAYLAMVLPLTVVRLGLAIREQQCRWTDRLVLGGLLAAQFLCLVFTYSRAGWLAAMLGLGVTFALGGWALGRRAVAYLVLGVSAFAGLMLFTLSLLPPLSGDAPHALQALTSLFRWQGATAQIRLLGWQACLNAMREHAWLGYGPATFSAVLPWHFPPTLAPFGGAGALGARPHNVFLELVLESGVPSLVCYGLTFLAILKPLLAQLTRGALSKAEGLLLAALVGSLAANLVTYCFSFESVTSAVLFWSLAGMAHAAARPTKGRLPAKRPALGAAVALAGILPALWMMVPDVLASLGESLASQHDWQPSVTMLGRAIRLAPTPDIFMGIEGDVYGGWALEEGDEMLWVRGDAIHALRVRSQPRVALYWQNWGDYLRRWHNAEAQNGVALRSVHAFDEALRLSPRDPDLWLDRGLAWLEAGQPQLALADIDQAQALLPGYTRYYGAMSVYALSLGDVTEAAEWQARALAAQSDWDAWAWRR